jgi:hypothetical protein
MLEHLARLGYVCKAVIFAVAGSLAVGAALRRGGRVTDTSGALRVILGQPYGRALLLVLAIGLCGYAVWRVLDAIRDPDHHGTDFNGIVTRIGNLVRALIYGGLGIESFRLFRGMGGSNGREVQMWTARIMDIPLGSLLVGLLGAIIVIYGVSEVIASFKGGYSRTLDITPIPARLRPTAEAISRFGIGARGVIIAALGFFLVRAAFQQDPSEAHGQRDSMLELANAAGGRWMLLFIGAGLLAYAVDQAIHARCRRIKPVT